MKEYTPADPVRKLANEHVIPDWHPELNETNILYLFTEDEMLQGGRRLLAKVKRTSALEYHLGGGVEVVMIVDYACWDQLLSAKQRIALIDHELCHLKLDEKGNLQVVGHDLEEFCAVVQRHGAWSPDIEAFNKAQLDLPLLS